jgi:hypothetical protein
MDTNNVRASTDRAESDRPPGGVVRRRLWSAIRLAEVRLRLPLILVVAAVVVGRWDSLRNHWDRMTRGETSESIAGHAVSADTEYFCPMDPGVVADWPARCGVCNMALVRRKRGEAAMLPDGVVSRMQLSPYRVQLAGIRTEPVEFRALSRDWGTSGFVTRQVDTASVEVEVPPRQAPWIVEGSEAEVTCTALPDRALMVGQVQSLTRDQRGNGEWRSATVLIPKPPRDLRNGLIAAVRFTIPVATLEPFRSMPRNPPPLTNGEPRTLYVCLHHPDSTATVSGRCSLDGTNRVPRDLADFERVRWWCPMHPAVKAKRPGASCRECGGMELRPRVVAYAPPGQVLAVPQSAVVDSGELTVVYVEGMPGMFDGVEVELGDRCGDFYPVVRGLEAGQRVAVAGAFLLDAETRLNPGLASSYFGASRGRRDTKTTNSKPVASRDEPAPAAALDRLDPPDRSLAEVQKVCPVTGLALGTMGTPVRQVVSGRAVFLCCAGCRSKLLADPDRYLAKLPKP